MIQSHIDRGRSPSERLKLGLLNPQCQDFKWKSTHLLEDQVQAVGFYHGMFACFMNDGIVLYEASVVPVLHSRTDYPIWLVNYHCRQVLWINEHWIFALFVSSVNNDPLLCQISFSSSKGMAFCKQFSLSIRKNGPYLLIPLDVKCGSICVVGVQNDTGVETIVLYVASESFDDLLENGPKCSKLEHLVEIQLDGGQKVLHFSASDAIATDTNAVVTIAFATVSAMPNAPNEIFLHQCKIQHGFESIPKLILCDHFYQLLTGRLGLCTGIHISGCGKKLVFLSRHDHSANQSYDQQSTSRLSQPLLYQISVFTWSESSFSFIFDDSLNIRSPLFHASIKFETDKSEVSILTHSTFGGDQLTVLKWSPDTNSINEEELGSPAIGDLLGNPQVSVNVLFFQKEIFRNRYSSSVFLIFSVQNVTIESPIKSKNNLMRSSPPPPMKLCWCYKRNTNFDFSGAMYPVGYQLVMESYLYREKEDEFDRIDGSFPVNNNLIPQTCSVQSFPVTTPKARNVSFPFCESVAMIKEKFEMFGETGKNDNFEESNASNTSKSTSLSRSADILPILSTCRISIIDGVSQIKPPSVGRIAIEDWLAMGYNKHLARTPISFNLHAREVDSTKKGTTADVKSQRYINISRTIESACRDNQLPLHRKVEFLQGAVERVAKTEYNSYIRKLRGKERAAARQQEKQALLLSLLKENEEEKKKILLQEQEQQCLKREVAEVLNNLVAIMEQNTVINNVVPIYQEELGHQDGFAMQSSISIDDNVLNCV